MAAILTSDLTTKTINGTGVFDNLMEAANVQLQDQFDKNRIKSTEYATVYLGAMQTAMGQAIQFLLGQQQADKNADLIAEQILAIQAETAIKNAQSAQDLLVKQEQIDLSVAQQALVASQTVSEDKNNALNGTIDKQILQIVAQTTLIDSQNTTEINKAATELKKALDLVSSAAVRDAQSTQDLLNKAEEILLSTSKRSLLTEQIASEVKNNALGGILDKQIAQIVAQTTLTDNQSATELNKALDLVSNTSVRNAQSSQDILNKAAALLKTNAEQALLTQKTDTEKAQILDTVNAVAVVGVIGKQKTLFTAQTDGFARDAEQKVLKILMDSYAVRRSTDSIELPPLKADNTSIDVIIQLAATGINAGTI